MMNFFGKKLLGIKNLKPWLTRQSDNYPNLYLQDKKPVVVQVDAAILQQRCDLLEGILLPVDKVLAAAVLVRCPGHDQMTAWDDLIVFIIGL